MGAYKSFAGRGGQKASRTDPCWRKLELGVNLRVSGIDVKGSPSEWRSKSEAEEQRIDSHRLDQGVDTAVSRDLMKSRKYKTRRYLRVTKVDEGCFCTALPKNTLLAKGCKSHCRLVDTTICCTDTLRHSRRILTGSLLSQLCTDHLLIRSRLTAVSTP